MEKESLQQFYEEFFQDIVVSSEAEQVYKEEKFFEKYTDYLIDEGEFDEAIYSHYQPVRGGIRVDGYCGSPSDAGTLKGVLSLIVIDFKTTKEVETITNTEIEDTFKRVQNFVIKSLDSKFRNSLEETDPGYGLADLISTQWNEITKLRFYLLSNRNLSSRATGKETEQLGGKQASYAVWDISRLSKLASSGAEREKLIVDFHELPGGPLRALKVSGDRSLDVVYLTAVPGLDLAYIYDRWGTRLLEQNVRVFLQARSSVNKGIKRTIEEEPARFFAFNNGITATAERVVTEPTDEGFVITKLENLQIVNGGQTTASIYSAYMRKINLESVAVQMKLCVVSPSAAKELVPRISQSANSQNKVSAADFFSNHPFHIRMENFSRTVYAPAKEGSFTLTKWYYERARGQYRDEQAYLKPSEKAKFLKEYPKNQLFTKTDLAKYIMVWTNMPYYVNRGAQKNFAKFAESVSNEWEKNNQQFSEEYYKSLIAKKIVYNGMEKIVPSREWYEAGGYRSQHVVLAIAALANGAAALNKEVDFGRIWLTQGLSPAFERAMAQAADVAHEVLMNPQVGYRNISEWAKQSKCWDAIKSIKVNWDNQWVDELISKEEAREIRKEGAKAQKEQTVLDANVLVVEAGAEYWDKVLLWMLHEGEGTEKERSITRIASNMSANKLPTPEQSIVLVEMMNKFKEHGCPYKFPPKSRRKSHRS